MKNVEPDATRCWTACEALRRVCRFLGELSFPVYIMHFPLAYMQMAWVKAHASAPLA